ncbi:MAG: MBL fold metallo-hydrolase, partial [Solirubrobacteraceae bacterium]
PIEPERIRVLVGGEQIGSFQVLYTPGHASHHVSYLHEDSGRLFGGDVVGVRITSKGPVLAPTPPPDIDLASWRRSLELIESLSPRALVATHFGIHGEVARHLRELRECLDEFERRAGSLTQDEFAAQLRSQIASRTTPAIAACYEQAMAPAQSYAGLRRWLSPQR